MGKVYRVDDVYGTEYFDTAKEVDRCKASDEELKSVECVNAAKECNRLQAEAKAIEKAFWRARVLLEELLGHCTFLQSDVARKVKKFIEDNPLPPAGSADRDGQRSYGTG